MNVSVTTLAPFEKDAKMFAMNSYTQMIGDRFRFEPTPNKLSVSLEVGHLIGELSGVERILAAIENDEGMNRDTILGELHLYIMQVNNSLVNRFGIGRYIEGVEVFTNRYIAEQNQNFVQ